MKIGCHVSNKGDLMLLGAVQEAISYNANSLMVYLGPPQNSRRKPLDQLKIGEARKLANEHQISFDNLIIHAPYIVNLAQDNEEKRRFAVEFIISEVNKAGIIGAKSYVFHPGNHLQLHPTRGLENIANSIKEILIATTESNVNLLAETMSGKGSECCYLFPETGALLKAVDNPRLKVCFDTCHVHDAGYDLVNNYDGVFAIFDQEIGLENLSLLHVNDSKNETGSHKDRHENIGYGKIGFDILLKVVEDKRFSNIVKILETPYIKVGDKEYPPYKEEIAMFRNREFNDFISKMKERMN